MRASIAGLLLAWGAISEVSAQAQPPYTPAQREDMATLDRLLAAGDIPALQRAMLAVKTEEQAAARLDWGKSRVMGGGPMAATVVYAQLLWSIGISTSRYAPMKETAGLMTMYALLQAHADGFKCADPTAPSGRIDRFLSASEWPLRTIAELPKAKQQQLVATAIALEKRTAPMRGDDADLCRHGLQETQDILKYRAEHNLGDEGKELKPGPGGVGKTAVLPAIPGYVPKFQRREEWEPKQAAARETFPAVLESALAAQNARR
jgi:hypothetical protein